MELSRIAGELGCSVAPGAAGTDITRIASLDGADEHCMSFVADASMAARAAQSRAYALIVKKGRVIEGKVNLEVDDPYLGYAKVAALFEDTAPVFGAGIHESAVVDAQADVSPSACIGPRTVIGHGAVIGAECRIGAGCVIERDSVVGDGCRIDSGVIIRYGCRIGSRVIIQSGTVVGSDGFANAMEADGRWVRIPCFGSVAIEDDVHIGACVTIDRGNFEPTRIRSGARLDNLIHVAHNVDIGERAAIAAQTGISGSTKIGAGALIGGQAGFVGHIEIGARAFVGAKAGVSKDVAPGAKVTGYPARDLMKMRRIEAAQQQLPDMIKQMKSVREKIEKIESTLFSED